jgi:diguanylate cyclase (GGDEF)-like protein
MKQKLESLRRLARMAVQSEATKESLTALADTLRDTLDLAQVFFVYSEDVDWLTCGDCGSGDDVGTKKKGLWLVQQQAEMYQGPVAFNVRNRLVEDLTGDLSAKGREYIGLRVPTSESPSELLIMRGHWQKGIDAWVPEFVDLVLPSLTFFLERMLNAARGGREREQMKALANTAEVLTQSEDAKSVLEDLTTAIANVIGYEIAILNIWDEAAQEFTIRVMNRFRWQDTSLGREWLDMMDLVQYPAVLESIRTRQPVLMADIQSHELVPEVVRNYYKWVMLRSGAEIPTIFGDEVLGSMGIASFRPRAFPPEEVEFLRGVAAQTAIALKARQLYKALAESEKQLREYSDKLRGRMEIQHRLARTDALTGIPNRRYAEEVIEGECARAQRQGRRLCVAMVDVDGLKGVNDGYGHDAGDEVLVRLAQIARWSCRRGDVVGRYGGDEFLFVLPEAGLRAACRFGERFRSKVEKEKIRLSGRKTVGVRVSLGVAEYKKGDGETPAELIKRADGALYEAKSLGGNITCPRSPTEQAA